MSELTWKPYHSLPDRAVAAYIAQGEEWNYMVAGTPEGEVVLSRWKRSNVISLQDIWMTAATALDVTGIGQGKAVAEQFDRGESVMWAPNWRQG